MNDDMNAAFGYGMVFGALVGAVPLMQSGAMIGSWLAGMEYERVAIEAKVAEYDSQTGVFQYKIVEEDGKK